VDERLVYISLLTELGVFFCHYIYKDFFYKDFAPTELAWGEDVIGGRPALSKLRAREG
jgi:hypothetical protein